MLQPQVDEGFYSVIVTAQRKKVIRHFSNHRWHTRLRAFCLHFVSADRSAGRQMITDKNKKYELEKLNISFERQVELDAKYKDVVFKRRFRADLIAEENVLVENKAIVTLSASDEVQLFNYLKTTGLRVGLLFNFWCSKLQMIRRIL